MGRREFVLAGWLIAGLLAGGVSLRAGDHAACAAEEPDHQRWVVKQKIIGLLELPDDRLLAELEKWPRFQEMKLEQKGRFLERIARMRAERIRAADREAERLGLTLSEDQRATFRRQYWQRREEMARQLWKETEGQRKSLREKLEKELKAQFASKDSRGGSDSGAGTHP